MADVTEPSFPLDRRRFLVIAASVAAGTVLAACGRSGSGALDGLEGDLQVVKRFPADTLVPGRVRLPVSLADTKGIIGNDGRVDVPASLTGSVTDPVTGKVVVENLVAPIHGEALAQPYWLFEVDIPAEGIYVLAIDQAPTAQASFQLMDPSLVLVPRVGEPLPPFDTPTLDDSRGVDPICTRTEGTCPFHGVTLTEALASGKPVAYLIGTPAYCQTGTCAPALEFLIEAARTKGDSMVFVHADVYADSTASVAAPAVRAYELTYEPILFVTDADGILRTRLDIVYDAAELAAALG